MAAERLKRKRGKRLEKTLVKRKKRESERRGEETSFARHRGTGTEREEPGSSDCITKELRLEQQQQ